MSRQNKAAKKLAEARQWSKLRQSGGKGPAKTQPKHGKERTQWKVAKAEREAAMKKAHEASVVPPKAEKTSKKPTHKKGPAKKAA